jgi:hypothetical protein
MWIARSLLDQNENCGVLVSTKIAPLKATGNGAGMHTNFLLLEERGLKAA